MRSRPRRASLPTNVPNMENAGSDRISENQEAGGDMSYEYRSVLMRGAVLAAAAVISTSALADADLDAKIADPANWAAQAGDYSNHRHSTLKQISESNVGKLQVAWTMSTG